MQRSDLERRAYERNVDVLSTEVAKAVPLMVVQVGVMGGYV